MAITDADRCRCFCTAACSLGVMRWQDMDRFDESPASLRRAEELRCRLDVLKTGALGTVRTEFKIGGGD